MLVKVFRSEYRSLNEDDYSELLKGVTDWEDVSEQDIKILRNAGYTVIEQFSKSEIENTVASLIKEYEANQRKAQIAKEKYTLLQKQREQASLERKIARAKKLLEKHASN